MKDGEKVAASAGAADDHLIFARKRKQAAECDAPENSNTITMSLEEEKRPDGSMRELDLEDVESRREAREFESESSSMSNHGVFSVEGSPKSEAYGDPKVIIRLPTKQLRQMVHVMPSASELEDFFSAAEIYQQKRFVQKYNYDIVRDVPLEGRYQWVHLQP